METADQICEANKITKLYKIQLLAEEHDRTTNEQINTKMLQDRAAENLGHVRQVQYPYA